MRNLILLISLLIMSFSTFSAKIPDDNLLLGTKTATDKGFEFNFNLGSNPKLKVLNDSDHTLNFDFNAFGLGDGSATDKKILFNGVSKSLIYDNSEDSLTVNSKNFTVGDGTTSEQSIKFNYDSGTKKISVNPSNGKLSFDNGTGLKALGSGGGGGGTNYNNAFTSDDNANAEDGTTGWTASAGTFTAPDNTPTNGPLGEKSFSWIPAAQNDTLSGPELNGNQLIFRGKACEASFEYSGLTAGSMTLRVIDGNGDERGIFTDSLGTNYLPHHDIFTSESIFFLCPTETEITGDSEKGKLYFQLKNTGASASAEIVFDTTYVGTNKGLTETILPDRVLAHISSAGAIYSQSTEWISSVSHPSAGFYTINFNSGIFTEPPYVCGLVVGNNDWTINYDTLTSSLITVALYKTNGVATDTTFQIELCKKGADAKQSVQVYKSIPKEAQNSNKFSARYGTTNCTSNCSKVSEDFAGFFPNAAGRSSTGIYQLNAIYGSNLTEIPSCKCNGMITGSGAGQCSIEYLSTSSINIRISSATGVLADGVFSIDCSKQGADVVTPTVQPVVIPNAVFYGPYDLSISGTNWTTLSAKGLFLYANGSWYMHITLSGYVSVSVTSLTVTISNILFTSSDYGVFSTLKAAGDSRIASGESIAAASTPSLYVASNDTDNFTHAKFSGWVPLASKPTAYVPQ